MVCCAICSKEPAHIMTTGFFTCSEEHRAHLEDHMTGAATKTVWCNWCRLTDVVKARGIGERPSFFAQWTTKE